MDESCAPWLRVEATAQLVRFSYLVEISERLRDARSVVRPQLNHDFVAPRVVLELMAVQREPEVAHLLRDEQLFIYANDIRERLGHLAVIVSERAVEARLVESET